MGAVMKRLGGRASGKAINALVVAASQRCPENRQGNHRRDPLPPLPSPFPAPHVRMGNLPMPSNSRAKPGRRSQFPASSRIPDASHAMRDVGEPIHEKPTPSRTPSASESVGSLKLKFIYSIMGNITTSKGGAPLW